MAKLKCDICGGKIIVQSGGQFGECENCGANYSLDRMRELASGMKVSVTGTKEDVEQWKALLKTYLAAFDYDAAEGTVKKILEAAPADAYANEIYGELQELKYFEIRNGVLTKYLGRSEHVTIPDGVKRIEYDAFKGQSIVSVKIPNSVTEIGLAFPYCRSLASITIPGSVKKITGSFYECSSLVTVILQEGLEEIGDHTFFNCSSLTSITIPSSVKRIGAEAFHRCRSLTNVTLQEGLEEIGDKAFVNCAGLTSVTIPSSLKRYGTGWNGAFSGCSALTNVKYPNSIEVGCLDGSKWATEYAVECKKRERRFRWREYNRCQHCGGEFKGVFTKTCSDCGKVKDY